MTLTSKNQHLTRQMGLIPLHVLDQKINIIGSGAIGSFTALSLAKMGFTNLTVFDDDIVDTENLSGQFFRHSDVGKPKVTALKELIFDFTGETIEVINDRWNGAKLDGIIISAVDSMEARKQIFDAHYKKAFNTKLVIDSRMGAQTSMLYTYNPLSIVEGESYEKSLYSDSEAVQEPCTAKATAYCALGLSSYVCSVIKEYVVNNNRPKNSMFDFVSLDIITNR